MNNIIKECPKCKSKNVTLNSQMNPMQNHVLGKDLKIEKYPKYLCKDCSKEFDE